MDLDVVDVLKEHVVLQRDRQRVTGDVTESGTVLKKSADTAGCQNYGLAEYSLEVAFLILGDDALADILLTDQIDHGGMLVKIDILLFSDVLEELAGDLLTGDVLVVEDTGSGVAAFLRKVQIVALLIEVDVVVEELSDDDRRLADHGVDGFSRILVMAGTECILEVILVVFGVLESGDTALSEVGRAVLERVFGEHVNGKILRKMKCAEQSGCTGTNDHNICGRSGIGHMTTPPNEISRE